MGDHGEEDGGVETVAWLPYLRIDWNHGDCKSGEYALGKGRLLPDTPEVWQSTLGRQRPGHLQIFRDFPLVTKDEEGKPCYGSLIVCDDAEWLTAHADAAVAVLYFIIDDFKENIPAEVLAYQLLRLNSDKSGSGQMVTFGTKRGQLIESSTSLRQYPPLPVRHRHGWYRPDTRNKEHASLLAQFQLNPADRLIVAVRQYFRSQFGDVFTSSLDEDYATCCSAIEAAIDLDTRHAAADKFVEALCGIYGDDEPIDEFFRGLYVARSVNVHGVKDSDLVLGSGKDADAYHAFCSYRGKITLMRSLTRDVILRALGRADDPYGFEPPKSARKYLRTVLLSDDLWDQVRGKLTRCNAADKLLQLDDEEWGEFEDLVLSLSMAFDWPLVRSDIDGKKVHACICTCALMAAKLTGGTGDVYEATDTLGKAADSSDDEAVRTWLWEHYDWNMTHIMSTDRLSTVQLLARILAGYFESA